jgi:hypothetical protein
LDIDREEERNDTTDLCKNGCCFGNNGQSDCNSSGPIHDDESGEDTDDEPFTDTVANQIDIRASTRWSLQRGAKLWLGISSFDTLPPLQLQKIYHCFLC